MANEYKAGIKFIKNALSFKLELFEKEDFEKFERYILILGTKQEKKSLDLLAEILRRNMREFDEFNDHEYPRAHEIALEVLRSFKPSQNNTLIEKFLHDANSWDENLNNDFTSEEAIELATNIAIANKEMDVWTYLKNIFEYAQPYVSAKLLVEIDPINACDIIAPKLFAPTSLGGYFGEGFFNLLDDVGESIRPKLIRHLHWLLIEGGGDKFRTDAIRALRRIEGIPFSTEMSADDFNHFPDRFEYGIESLHRVDQEAAGNIVLQMHYLQFYEISNISINEMGDGEWIEVNNFVNETLLVKALNSNQPVLIEAAAAFIARNSRWYDYVSSTETIQALGTVCSDSCGPAIVCALSFSDSIRALDKLLKWFERRYKDYPNWPSPEKYIEKKAAILTYKLIKRLGVEAVKKVAVGLHSKESHQRAASYLLLGLFSTDKENHSVLSAVDLGGFPKFFFGEDIDQFVNKYTIINFEDSKIEELEETPRKLAALGPMEKKCLSANHQ